MASKCRKFVANMFNKTKCQACFGSKEAHTAEALENNKASRKVSKCGYLFVSPDLDFSNPLDRTRRWQRRFFRLYDDGELTFSVDENPDTVPQGCVDMNRCSDVLDAETITSHPNSIAVVTQEKTEYFKANSKEEIQWWHDILIEYPKSLKSIKPRRKPNFSGNKENIQPTQGEDFSKEPEHGIEVERLRLQQYRGDLPAYATFKGVRNLKHKYDKNHQDGMRKSSSLHDLSSSEEDKVLASSLVSTRFLSCSGDHIDVLHSAGGRVSRPRGQFQTNPYFTIPRTSWPSRVHPTGPLLTAPAAHPSLFNSSSSISSTSSTNSATHRGSLDDRSVCPKSLTSIRDHPKHTRERSASLKDFSTQLKLPRNIGSLDSIDHTAGSRSRSDVDDLSQSMSADETDGNETDELKMARSSELSASSRTHCKPATSPEESPTKYEDLVYMKKGWLVKQGPSDQESRKHWFVLAGNSLRYYKDAKAEEANSLDGRIDLSTCYEVSEINGPRNYGFKIKTQNGEYMLTAMTSGIRNNWMKAVRLCMDLHSSTPKRGLSPSLTGKALAGLATRSIDDFEVGTSGSGSQTSTSTSVTSSKGETAFQLVGRRDLLKKEGASRNIRRHHSDVNPGNVNKILSIKEFSSNPEVLEPLSFSSVTSNVSTAQSVSVIDSSYGKINTPPLGTKFSWQSSLSSDSSLLSKDGEMPLKRYVEGSDSLVVVPSFQFVESRRSKRNITSESSKEEEKREMMRRAKSPSARIKEKSRAAKTPRLHSPPLDEDGAEYHRSSGTGQSASSSIADTSLLSDAEDDMDMIVSSEEQFPEIDGDLGEDAQECASSDSIGDGILVEILESEVESLKTRLDHTQTQLVKMHETNFDLKSRLQKESSQSSDASSARWSQQLGQQIDPSQVQTMKRQLKEAKDTVQKQRMEIESLKSKLDMSVSKLTGTEKALSEALRDYKQEKDKFLKLSSEWNRRIRTLEGQLKDNTHKLERTRESMQAKERECRRLELEVKTQQQKTREQDREILKLKAVEHEYNQIKERLDNKERELLNANAEIREKETLCEKLKGDFKQQFREMKKEFAQERDDLENHLEELKEQLNFAQERQTSLQDNITTNMADLLSDKDDVIAQLEEKMTENDRKMVDLNEELQAEMNENAELLRSIDDLQEEKQNLQDQIEKIERQLVSLKEKVAAFEKDNNVLRQHLSRLKEENSQLTIHLNTNPISASHGDPEKEVLQKTILDLNRQIQGLQMKLMEKVEDFGHSHCEHEDLLHNILIFDSDLKEVNNLLMNLHAQFDAYLDSLPSETRKQASTLAEMVDDIGHRCIILQETLHEQSSSGLFDGLNPEYRHQITVDTSSGSQVIMDEYRGLKNKFDRAVAELKKLRKEVNDVYSCYDELEKKDKALEEQMQQMKVSYIEKVELLMQRVNQLSSQLASTQSTVALQAKHDELAAQSSDTIVSQEIEHQLFQLDSKITMMETALSQNTGVNSSTSKDSTSRLSLSPQDSQAIVSRLKEMKLQLESSNAELKEIVTDFKSNPGHSSSTSQQHVLMSRIDGCGKKLDRLTHLIQEGGSQNPHNNPEEKCNGGNPSGCKKTLDECASSMAKCMREIKERIQEIGEQLDCLEDETEDSDDEEAEATTFEDVRERLSALCEYVEQHSQFSNEDWHILQLLNAQKEVIVKSRTEVSGVVEEKDRIKEYANRLSLEALILVEMAHLVEQKDDERENKDPVLKELSILNSKIMSLHRKLDQETTTLCLDNSKTNVLAMQSDLLAEKILLEGQLYSCAFAQNCHLSEESSKEEEEKKMHPKLLAVEALMRSQLDSYVGQNLDKSCDELWSSASHLTLRSLVQGELTFALSNLKKHLTKFPQVQETGDSMRDFIFERLKQRHKIVMDISDVYQTKVVQALTIIISKESEEMTLVDGPENVLDAVCSELSTVMEKHIQRCKEKVRTSEDTHSARRWDMMVNQLRSDREVVLNAIREQHSVHTSDEDIDRCDVDIPFQSLDSTINNLGEILSLRAILSAHVAFLSELFKIGNTTILESIEMEETDEEDENPEEKSLQKRLDTFMCSLIEALRREAQSKQVQAEDLLSGKEQNQSALAIAVSKCPQLQGLSAYSETLSREAVFSAQTTFLMYKIKLQHEQEIDALKLARPVRGRTEQSSGDSCDGESGVYHLLEPMEEVLDTKFDDELETLRVVASQVGKLREALSGRDWGHIDEHIHQLEQKLQAELELAQQRHEVHLDLFKQEENKLEHAWEEAQQERYQLEERCSALEVELRSMTMQHDDEVERMRQDVMTAVHAIRANEEESEIHLSDKVQRLTKQMLQQKENVRKALARIKEKMSGDDQSSLLEEVEKEIKEIMNNHQTEYSEEEDLPPLPSQPPPDVAHREENLIAEEKLELLKKEKDEALAEETRNTKAALDAMRKAYEEELKKERDKYREMITTMYNEDFVAEIRRRHQIELEKTQEELKQLKMHYMSRCEDYKLMEVKMGQMKQDYESHINQLISSNDHLDDMVNQEFDRLKDFIKNRPANLTTGNATMEEELYDAQILIRVKDAELQKLRSQVKNLENSLHRTTEEHRQSMTQYLQALKENQELRKEYQAETGRLQDQLDKLQHDSGMRRPIRRTPSFHQRARSPSPPSSNQQKDSTSAADHTSRDSNRRRRIEPKDLRRSKSSPSLPYVFDAKGIPTPVKTTGKPGRQMQTPKV